jgi:death on curing protein
MYGVYDYERLFKNLSQNLAVEWMDTEEVEAIHDFIVDRWGGIEGIRDSNVLHNIFFKTPYLDQNNDSGASSLYDVAAQYLYEVASKHPFNDANKRTAVATALTFLGNNGIVTKFDPVLLEQLVKKCASADRTFLKREFLLADAQKMFLDCRI